MTTQHHQPIVLLVEDDPHVRAMLVESLTGEGFVTLEAANGKEGLARFAAGKVDVVVTDILMPEMEGLQFIKALRGQAPELPIIAISGGAVHLSPGCNLELASMFGATHVIQKPLNIDDLAATIKRCLPA
ncbi:response regulator [Megalodesulfovibrio gigas]|uniref:Putative two-component response regulator n=1 Tax=Megalodesulfovibrio gigas (strain ATCC 19364 / DSM 1382 / NCIMB 9332 / VKM B-1759) TaxID=1121448 RepID=T2GCT6_MEGG1|nr:response regulator [Megalodesulfovibrio gigas]AGW14395.1 putative two-component response regulator [Megalodesulfovibrio gigas DSM 1382 = ATCC 19364]